MDNDHHEHVVPEGIRQQILGKPSLYQRPLRYRLSSTIDNTKLLFGLDKAIIIVAHDDSDEDNFFKYRAMLCFQRGPQSSIFYAAATTNLRPTVALAYTSLLDLTMEAIASLEQLRDRVLQFPKEENQEEFQNGSIDEQILSSRLGV